jgi:PST family polysaccharide transporter
LKPYDENGCFRPTADLVALRTLAMRGAGVTVFSSGIGLAIQIISTVVLARLLAPADFGLVAMVTTFSLLLVNFGVNGFTEVVIQWNEIHDNLVSNLFWINLGVGVLLTIAFAGAGTLLGRFYHDPLVAHVAEAISLTILITSTSVQHLALLKRAMRFSLVAVNDILARLVSVIVTIVLALAGWGYWALVAGLLAQTLSACIGAWCLCRWIPSLPRRVAGTGAMVRFALDVYGRFTVNYFARNTDNLLVGWRFNAQALGFYKKAYDLFALPAGLLVSSLTDVAVSAMSRLNRDLVQYRRYFLTAFSVLAFVGMGLGADLTLVGRDVIRVLLGPGWETAGRIFSFFGPGIGIMLLYGTHAWIHLSIGRPDRWLRWGLIEFSATFLLFILGLPWGPAGVAVAWAASFWILTAPALWYAGKPINLGVVPMIVTVWKYVLASVVAGCASALMVRGIPSVTAAPGLAGAITRIGVVSVLFVALYLGAVILLHGGCVPLYQVSRLLKETVPWSRFSRRRVAATPTKATVGSDDEAITLSA